MKQLKKKDLIIGEIYKHQNGNIVKYEFDGNLNDKIKGPFIGNNADNFTKKPESNFTISSLKLATPKEKHWLEVCIAANSFISYDEAMETFIPEYVECTLQQNRSDYKLGKIYKLKNSNTKLNLIENDKGGMAFYQMNLNRFKPSTKEAYDAQFVVKEPKFELPEKWYFKLKPEFAQVICEYVIKKKPHYNNVWRPVNILGNKYISNNSDLLLSSDNIYGTEITFEQFKKYVLKEQLEEPKDKVLINFQYKIIKVESSEGAIYQLGDKITVFTKDSPNKGKVFTIKGFRWNNAKTNICAITELHSKSGIGLDKIELYSEPKQIIITESTSDMLKLASQGINAIQINSELSLLEQAKLKYPIGTKFKNACKHRKDNDKIFEITSTGGWYQSTEESHARVGVYFNNEWIYFDNNWAEIIEDFKLPETWWITIENERHLEITKQYFSQYFNNPNAVTVGATIGCFPNRKFMKHAYCLADSTKQNNPQITFEQFEQYVLHNGFKVGDRFKNTKNNSNSWSDSEKEITRLMYVNNESVVYYKVTSTGGNDYTNRILTKNIVR